MNLTVKGIVIDKIDLGEADVLAELFTLEKGRITVKFKSVKKANSKLKGAKELFTFANFELTERGGKYSVIGAEVIDNFYSIAFDYERFLLSSKVLYLLKKCTTYENTDERTFVSLLKTINMLANSDVNSHLIVSKFLIDFLIINGYPIIKSEFISLEEDFVEKLNIISEKDYDELCDDLISNSNAIDIYEYLIKQIRYFFEVNLK